MILPFDEIKKILKDTWPDLIYIWPRDRQYVAPSLVELKNAIPFLDGHTISDIPGLFECDDRSLMMLSELLIYRLDQYKKGFVGNDEQFSWAVGEALGTFRVALETHSLLIAICDNRKVYLIEPSDNQIWLADPKVDQPFFVDFH